MSSMSSGGYGETDGGGGSSGVGSGGGSSSGKKYSYYGDDVDLLGTNWLQEAIDRAKEGNVGAMREALKYRDQKVSITGKDYGTDSDAAREEAGSHLVLKEYAEGIENGAVTETGLAMLHGTPTEPEYVLNSDQAGTLLENIATNDFS